MNSPGEKVTVEFLQWTCYIEVARYSNKRIGLVLINADANDPDPSPVAIASCNLPYNTMEHDEVAIKDYSENDGMVNALVNEHVILAPHRHIPSGHVNIPICRIDTTHCDFTGEYVIGK